ncbi:14080_t:CDS:2, partial [Ambispora leptoticha]
MVVLIQIEQYNSQIHLDQTNSQENNNQIIDKVLENVSEVLEITISILNQQTVIEERW